MTILPNLLNPNEYFHSGNIKTNIVLHHTAGNENPYNTAAWWNNDPQIVGTNFVIGGYGDNDGVIINTIPEEMWAWNLGIGNGAIESKTISIEMCSWGNLTQNPDGSFVSYVGTLIPSEQVIDIGFVWRGCRYFHKYSDAQLTSLEELLMYLVDKYPIDLSAFKEGVSKDWYFQLNQNALNGVSGIWNHTNYLIGKTDLYPDDRIIDMLNRIIASKNL